MEPRTTFVIGHILDAVSCIIIATYFYFHGMDPEWTKNVTWIPLVMITTIFFLGSASILPILYTLLGELFPTEIRALGVGLVQSSFFMTSAIIVKTYPDFKYYIGLSGVLYFYALMGLFNSFWGYLTIPDNRSKTLIEVEKSYDDKTPLISKDEN